MEKTEDPKFVFIALALYAGFIILLSWHHVPFRDEVQPLSAVAQSSSLGDLYRRMHNFGHPPLLVTVLYLVYHLLPYYFILKIVNVSICVGAIYIFLAHAPFSRLQKALFIMGFFPIYQYAVFSRDYSLTMLLMFAAAALYEKRHQRMITLGLVLGLLANAHAYALIITLAMTASLGVELCFSSQARSRVKTRGLQLLICAALIAGGLVFAIVHVIPDQTSMYYQPHAIGVKKIIHAFLQSLLKPHETFPTVFGTSSPVFVSVIIFLVYLYLWPKPYVLFFFFSGVIGLGMFYHLIFQSIELRYEGTFYLLLVTALWIENFVAGKGPWKATQDIVSYKNAFLTLLMIMQIGMAYPALREEMSHDYSSNRRFGQLVQKNPAFKDAIIIGDPDNNLEAMPYYVNNQIYFAREDRFGKYRELITTIDRHEISLGELLDISQKLKAASGRPLLIILGYNLTPQGPFTINTQHHGQIFTYSRESLADLNAHTTLVGSFHRAIYDENYDVYFLK